MKLVFGGSYQGKNEFVKEKFDLKEEDFFICNDEFLDINFEKKVISSIEKYVLASLKNGQDPISYINENLYKLNDKIIICEDVCCGVVPMDKIIRQWRDNTGKIMQILSRNSTEVYRVYCSLGERLK